MDSSKPLNFALPAPRRVFTAPIQPAGQQDASSSKSLHGSVDTLYDHPSVKIVSFTAGPRSFSIGPRTGLGGQDIEPGTLSWSSQLERTIAVGPFRIYRAPGSVAFLSCGSALQPILPKSQVWCVDEASSKFVLQIRKPNYWRIELPVAKPEDVHRAQLLREVFDKILQFEKTECPFKRSFIVELPERPATPVVRRPWTPVPIPGPALPPTPVTPVDVARIWKGPAGGSVASGIPSYQAGQGDVDGIPLRAVSAVDEEKVVSSRSDNVETPKESNKQLGQDASPVVETVQQLSHPSVSNRSGVRNSRCVTAPPQLMLEQAGAEPETVEETKTPAEEQAPPSPTGSLESFHSPQSFRSNPLPPSPPRSKPASPHHIEEEYLFPGPESQLATEPLPPLQDFEDTSDITTQPSPRPSLGRSASPTSEISDSATAPSSICDLDCPSPSPTPIPDDTTIPTSDSSSSLSSTSTTTSPSVTRRIRHRATTSSSISPSRRALSPLPSAANLFTPRGAFGGRNVSPMDLVRRLPMAVISKTCEILMSPPSHLINLMLKVAARIAAGEWRGFMFGTGEGGEKIEVGWDLEESDEEDNRRRPSFGGWKRRGSDWGPLKMAGSFPESDDEEEEEEPQRDWSGSLGVD